MMTCPLAGEERIMSIEGLVRHFSVVEDPRCQGKIDHRLIDILVIAVCAVIACAESWDDIALYGRSKLTWLRTFLDLPNGIPSHDTFRRVFMLIDPDAFERGFAAWVGSLVDGFEREVIAIDGKTLRRSFDRRRERSPLHLVSAWASEQSLVLGQRRVQETSNEITAIPELLDQLALENSIVTLDAMGCQTAIAERILARGADYLLVLKANHPLAYEAVAKHFDQSCLPWVSLGDEPFSPEGWDGDQAVKAGVNAPQAPLEQGGEGSGIAPGSAMAGFFSAGVGRWTASHMPVDTAQNSASAMIRMSRSSRPASLI